jgi:hypothetical protein
MAPKSHDYALLPEYPLSPNGQNPIFFSESTGKGYLQCTNCDTFLLLNAAGARTYLANHQNIQGTPKMCEG